MTSYGSFFHKKNPFIRIFLALSAGILFHWYFQPGISSWLCIGIGSFVLLGLFFFLPLFDRFRRRVVTGIPTTFLVASLGGLLAWKKDTRNHVNWLGKVYQPGYFLIVRLEEPLVEKAKSYKATATIRQCIRDNVPFHCKGKMVIYLTKDSTDSSVKAKIDRLGYGSLILFQKPIQEILNAGNPGGFDYRRFSLFKGISHQVFLKTTEWVELPAGNSPALKKQLYKFRDIILQVLRKNIPGEREVGLAEALLIGFKDDLDPALVQSYSNTGVVHIIAISGLHLGLIYAILMMLLQPVKKNGNLRLVRFLLIVTVLWGFSLLAGAQPSVLRSALMFSFIALGECMDRKTSIYNSIAASAFVLLCINPYWLWDLGFQLSYSAVLSIIIFMRPIYNLLYCRNRLLDLAWKLNAVTLAAQVLTLPICIYYFHQFPVYFILSNFIAVPLSSAILLGEIFLCLVSFIPAIALATGKALALLVGLMNDYIQKLESLPGSVWESMQVTGLQVVWLFILIASLYSWLMERKKNYAIAGLVCLLCFVLLRSDSFLDAANQQKLIIYNVPRKKAMALVDGRRYVFVGDSSLLHDDLAQNFHLKPSRTLYRMREVKMIKGLVINDHLLQFRHLRVILINKKSAIPVSEKIPVDLVLVSGNKTIDPYELAARFKIKQLVVDGSVSAGKSILWKKKCDSLGIPFHDVKEKGAFVMNLR